MMRSFPPALLVLAACSGGATTNTLATRADSAGIAIVTSGSPSWGDDDGWRIDSAPVLEIGPRDDNDPHYDLFQVRGARLLPGGEVLVLVGGHRQLRLYGADGEWVRTIGRDGDGPGELRSPGGVAVAGDTIYVIDFQLSRIASFTLNGDPLTTRSFPVLDGTGRIPPSERLADGRWIGWSAIRIGAPGRTEGLSRQPLTYWLVPADLASAGDSITTTPGGEEFVRIMTGSGGLIELGGYTPPLGRNAPTAADQDRFVWGDNASPELRIHSLAGTLQTILRWHAPRIPVDAALLERIKQAALTRAGDDARARGRVESQFTIPSPAPEVPYFSDIHLDPDGAIWLQEYPILATDSISFRVFQRDGQFLGRLALPPRHNLIDIGRDRLLTVWHDDDDLEHVRAYALRRR